MKHSSSSSSRYSAMCRTFVITHLFFLYVTGFSKFWPEAVTDVAQREFRSKYILLLLGRTESHRDLSRKLLHDNVNDSVARVVRFIEKEWTILLCDYSYKPPPSEVGYFKVQRAKQIIIVLDELLLSTRDLFITEINRWKTNPAWLGRASILVVVQCHVRNGPNLAFFIMSELWRLVKAVNVVVLLSWRDQVEFFSWVPYSPQCKVKVQRLGEWNENTSFNATLFPQKNFWNLNQCKITAASTDIHPFSFYSNSETAFTNGFEVLIFHSLSQMMNFSYDFVRSPEKESPWSALIDGKPAGLIGRLVRHEADVAFFGMRLTWERFSLVDTIDSYYGGNFVWGGPLPKHPPRWKSILAAFEPYMWLGTLISFLMTVLMVGAISKMDAAKAFLATWAPLVNTSVPWSSTQPLFRLFMASYLLFVINVNAAYQSGLFGVLTRGLTVTPVENALDAAKEGVVCAIYPSTIPEMLFSYPHLHKYITTHNLANFTVDHVSVMRRIAQGAQEMVLLAELTILYETILRFTTTAGKPLVRILKDRYGTYEPVFFMGPHHPLQPTVQMATRRLIEGGWVQHHVDEVMNKARRARSNSEFAHVEDDDDLQVKKLSLGQLLGAFASLMLFLLISGILFVMEIAYANFSKQNKREAK